MIIAEKLQTIAENEQKVYKAGYDKGAYETEIWDALLGTPEFALDGFKTPNVVLNLKNQINIRYLTQNRANYANQIVKHLTINCPNQVSQAFGMIQRLDNCLTHLTLNIDFSQIVNAGNIIQGAEVLEIVDGVPINWSSCTSSTQNNFGRCYKLREIRFAPNSLPLQILFGDCSELSDDSVNSIISGLMQLESTQTIKFHKTVGEKLTDGQKSVIALKGWTLAY